MTLLKLSLIVTTIVIICTLLTHCSSRPDVTYVPSKCPAVALPMAPVYPLDNLTGNQPIKACVISLEMCIDYSHQLNTLMEVYKQ